MFEDKLKKMNINLPEASKPLAAYQPAIQAGDFIYTSGQLPMSEGKLLYKGKLGEDFSSEEGYNAAKICAVNCLSAIKSIAGSLDKIERIVKVTGFVNSSAKFSEQPAVINGASDFLLEIFGEAGKHARSAVGVNELPLGAAVELEIIVKLKV